MILSDAVYGRVLHGTGLDVAFGQLKAVLFKNYVHNVLLVVSWTAGKMSIVFLQSALLKIIFDYGYLLIVLRYIPVFICMCECTLEKFTVKMVSVRNL